MVSSISIVFMVISLLFGILIPVVALVYCRKKFNCKLKSFLFGCLIFFTFAIVLEGIAHSLILNVFGYSESIQSNVFLLAIYGGLMAGFFEETGRFFAFKNFFKKEMEDDHNALMYGAGHGGFEAFYLLVPGMISNLVMANLINSGQTSVLFIGQTEENSAIIQSTIDSLISLNPSMFLLGVVERFSAVTIHLALSIIVWFAVKNSKTIYYGLAVLLHALVDLLTVILNNYVNPIVLEIILLIASGALAYYSYTVYKKEHQEIIVETPKPYMYRPNTNSDNDSETINDTSIETGEGNSDET